MVNLAIRLTPTNTLSNNLIFIGGGALLVRALSFAETSKRPHQLICCPPRDTAIPALKKMEAKVLESADINSDLYSRLQNLAPGIIFSISNKYIISDTLLSTGWRFFNIHNGLIQYYRGIAEICLLASLCHQSNEYGVTLHEILPSQPVDSGLVVCQNKFKLVPNTTLEQLITKTFNACLRIFVENFNLVMNCQIELYDVPKSSIVYNYSMIEDLLDAAPASNIDQIIKLGFYQNHFPVLTDRINKWYGNRE